MRKNNSRSPTPRSLFSSLLTTFAFFPEIRAISFTAVPSPSLNLTVLGRVALIGDFASASLYTYLNQTSPSTASSNGTQSLLTRYPNGAFTALESSDAYINSLATYTLSNGTVEGVLVGGNFTSLGGQTAQGMALYYPVNDTVRALPGLTGQVNSIFYDTSRQTAYVGGSFTGANQTNGISWTGAWDPLPFAGFNGPVNAIAKLPNGNIVFGGAFTGTGNLSTPATSYQQVVNLGGGTITATGSSTQQGYSNPQNIICKTSNDTGAGNAWLLADTTPGTWSASLGFGFVPARLRLYNSQVDRYATKTWRFVDSDSGGIMNLTYYGANGLQSCTAECPLANNASAQDFYFVNYVGMDGFRIEVDSWYGSGGGLGGIELFQNDIYVSAISSFNEPVCDSVSKTPPSVTTAGSWATTSATGAISEYLTASLPAGSTTTVGNEDETSVVFYPDIKQSGNYSVTFYTPGCISDGTCSSRGIVNITIDVASSSSTSSAGRPTSTQLYQTNNYQKYDQIYFGYISATSSSSSNTTTAFRPSITLAPAAGQSGTLTVVAQRVSFDLISSAGALNGLYEFNPEGGSINSVFSTSAIDAAGIALDTGAEVNAIVVVGDTTFVAGAYNSNNVSNIMAVGTTTSTASVTPLPSGGLNGPVQALYNYDSVLYVAGNFSNTANGTVAGLDNIAAFNTTSNSWTAIGAGVNGIVYDIVELTVNISDTSVDALAFSGYFNSVNAFDSSSAFDVDGVAIWVPSRTNWLHNLNSSALSFSGRLTASLDVSGSGQLFAGSVSSQGLTTDGAVELSTSSPLTLDEVPITIASTSSSASSSASRKVKRATTPASSDVLAATYYNNKGQNLTILAGSFEATTTATSSIYNLAIVNSTTSSDVVSGISSSGIAGSSAALLAQGGEITALTTVNDVIVAGGTTNTVSGTTNTADLTLAAVLLYNLTTDSPVSTQAATLTSTGSSNTTTINALLLQPNTTAVYVAGTFTTAGTTSCNALCILNTTTSSWTSTGLSFSTDSTITALSWASTTQLILAGNMTANGSTTTLASYSTVNGTFTPVFGAGNTANVPGAVTSFTVVDKTHTAYFLSGSSSSSASAFLTHVNTTTGTWTPIPNSAGLGGTSDITSLHILALNSTTSSSANTFGLSGTTLLITGALQLETSSFTGTASAALFNGTAITPLLFTSLADGSAGTIRSFVVENPQNLPNAADLSSTSSSSSTTGSNGSGSNGSGSGTNGNNTTSSSAHLATGYVVLIALAISLALIFLLVLAGILLSRLRRRREGYALANTTYTPYEGGDVAPQIPSSVINRGSTLSPTSMQGAVAGAGGVGAEAGVGMAGMAGVGSKEMSEKEKRTHGSGTGTGSVTDPSQFSSSPLSSSGSPNPGHEDIMQRVPPGSLFGTMGRTGT